MHFAHIGVILDKNPCIAIQPPSKAIMMPNRLEPELDIYQYPEHLRASLEQLPRAPGVYLFHGQSDSMPLYIGKSVNVRSRVMAHFRARDEAKLLRQTQRISCIATAGELGALLLEAQLIKRRQPLFNKRLRRSKQLCSLRLSETRVEIVQAKDIDFAATPDLYGLFANRGAAQEKLRAIADQHRLCYGRLGIDKLPAGRACFRFSLRKCAGACCGAESELQHRQRLAAALEQTRIACWPYAGRVALEEQGNGLRQYHVIHNWFYLGSVDSLERVDTLQRAASHFDSDGYKILCKPLMGGDYRIIELSS
ncbi:Excinuclease cho [Serratia ficaria]|uniref:Excinuclease cho n=2 Tax=Serratia ficaria TaxID=61651 RepID=A0A240BTS2_SERFI|nr:excinuclease Cho [Serratia ficaria]CAI0881236.1 Excinuclease cho [Serratia ficaria]CAI0899660.1 Excinuclease cho [Serratia ficaria]CAI0933502.1 Excinuclease cho [Serratia ficaria]CAI1518123.1 Excinuclease cho [Serratia ficaria]